jgi:hypothetical protein
MPFGSTASLKRTTCCLCGRKIGDKVFIVKHDEFLHESCVVKKRPEWVPDGGFRPLIEED